MRSMLPLFLLGFLFTSCGGGGSTTAPSPSTSGPKPVGPVTPKEDAQALKCLKEKSKDHDFQTLTVIDKIELFADLTQECIPTKKIFIQYVEGEKI